MPHRDAPSRPEFLASTPGQLEGVDESTWLDVIHKMDEVYSKLIEDEVELEKKNAELEQAYRELQTTHDALKLTQQQLLHSEKMASLGQLVAGVAHELNNPISFVLGNTHALQKYCARLQTYLTAVHAHPSGETLQQMRRSLRIDHLLEDLPSLIEGTLEGAQRTTDIVHGLKRFSAMDTEEMAPLNLVAVIERAIHWVQKGMATPAQVHWAPTCDAQVWGNAGQLQQVVMNLLQNAFDVIRTAEGGQVRVDLQVQDKHALVTVRDNGAGISPAHLARVFDPFFTTKPVGQGTGLGLSISYGIVEQHAGQLSVRNHPQGGAEFTLKLPCLRV
jgi:two-component system sensor histidine kinase HupT/HoxJ